MNTLCWNRKRFCSVQRPATLALIAAVVIGAAAPPTRGAELVQQAHSLRSVPADAAFYSVSLRLKEQRDIFLESKAYARLMEIPVVQLGKMQLAFQWQQAAVPQLAKLREYVDSPEGQEALALVKEMFSEEMFLYGSDDVAAAIELFMELNTIGRQARLEALARGEETEDVAAQRALEALEEHARQFKVPSMVFGWRIKDGQRAGRQLDTVHSLVRNLLDEQRPELSPQLQRDDIGGHEFLTLRLDGSMIPWDELRENAEVDDEQFNKWRELISGKTLALALGVVDDFVLLSMGDSTDHLETFGQGGSLGDQPAFVRLNKHADERVVSIGYLSKALAETLSSPERTIEDLAGAAEEVLIAAEVAEEQRAQLLEDIRGLGGEVKKYVPEPGELATIAFLTSRGYEGFKYSTSPQPMQDSSKPLSLLNHLGGSPTLLLATRTKENPEDYEQAIDWVKRIGVQVEKIVETKVDPEEWAHYQKYRDRGVELLERLDRVNREHFIPALADGQMALVMDTSAKSKQWFREMPESPKPLPMVEFAFVTSVSDAEHLRRGMVECFDIVRDAIALAREIHPEQIPEFELPEPKVRRFSGGGAMYVYELPEEWGIDSQVAINGGLTDSVAVASCAPTTTERLIKETSLDVDTTLDLKRPAAVVSHFQFAKMVDAIRPWIDYGFDVATGKLKVPVAEDAEAEVESEPNEQQQQQAAIAMQMGFVMPQIQQFLDFTTALQNFSSVTYEDDGVWVTHSETHFEDLN